MSLRMGTSAAVVVAIAIAACGGSTGGVGNGGAGADAGSDACATVTCNAGMCRWGAHVPDGECCAVCDPEPRDLCAGRADDCSITKTCGAGFELAEYVPGCCACRPTICSGVTCDTRGACPSGTHEQLAGCCGACVPDGTCASGEAPCSSFRCPTGYQALGPKGDGAGCCRSCEPDPAYCKDKAADYESWIAQRIAQLGATKCSVADDCTIVNLSNKCAGDCGTSLAKASASQVKSEAVAYGDKTCADCPPSTIACPAVVLVPRCTNGQCTAGP